MVIFSFGETYLSILVKYLTVVYDLWEIFLSA